jgi:hypothetical protein
MVWVLAVVGPRRAQANEKTRNTIMTKKRYGAFDTAEEAARHVECTLHPILPELFCIPQEWDDRIDCLVRLQTGEVVGEMLSLAEVRDTEIINIADRLRRVLNGEPSTSLRNAIWSARIRKPPPA